MSEDLVRSEALDFSYNSGRMGPHEAIGAFADLLGKHQIAVEVVTIRATDASGFPTIRLVGPRDAVKKAIIQGWNPGETDAVMDVYAEMMLGNPTAQFIWNSADLMKRWEALHTN